MKTNNFFKLLIFAPIFIIGCYGVLSVDERIPKGDYDIVFSTEVEGNDTIGFYSLVNENSDYLKYPNNLSSPYVLAETNLIALKKIADFGDPRTNVGYITILRSASQGLQCKVDDFYTDLIRPYGDQFVFYWDGVFNVVDPKECKIVSELLNLQDMGIDKEIYQRINGFSVNSQSNFLVLSSENRKLRIINMIRINLLTKEVFNYEKFGINPSISPDGKEVAYFGEDGIHVMDINGNDILKVSDDIPWRNWEGAFYGYEWPNPDWSSDGMQLIYHKCPGIRKPGYLCDGYGKYSVYLFDLKTGMERKLFDSGVNPSWIKR
jgi:hypothetical protein